MELRDLQRPMVRWTLEHPRCGVLARMGSGKTGAILSVIDGLRTLHDDPPPLVLAPRNVAIGTWPGEAAKWFGDRMKVSVILGSETERQEAIARKADLYVATYDNLQWLIETQFQQWRWSTVIADESTRLKGFRFRAGGKRAAQLARVAHTKVRRWVNLTGTPYGQGFADIWGQMWFLDEGAALGATYTAFRDRWFSARPGGLGGRLQWRVMDHSPAEIMAKIAPLCISIDPKNYMDLPELVVNPVHVTLPPRVAHIYRRAERELLLELERGELGIAHAGAKAQKLAQIANGAVYPETGADAEILHDQKLQALRSIVEEANGMPVLVAYEYRSDLARILATFPGAETFNSTTPKVAVEDAIKRWNDGDIPMLVLHPKSAGHGLNLQDGSCIAALYGQTRSLEAYQQFVERIGPVRQVQAGHPRTVWVNSIIAKGTVDEDAQVARETGQMWLDVFLERMRK